MKRRTVIILLSALSGMLVLIFDGKTASDGIRLGIDMCLQTLIPSLFPFFVLSGIITASILGQPISCIRPIGRFMHMPSGSESLFAVGILGGYPVGAGTVWSAYHNGRITESEANRLAIFCNNAGPSFIFGILGQLFPAKFYVWFLWAVQILSAILTGYLLRGQHRDSTIDISSNISIDSILNRSIRNMATVCGWVILFRMLLEFLNRWVFWLMKPELQVLVSGFLELSNGCLRLLDVTNVAMRFLIASVILSFGGLCILMQTQSVFPSLIMKEYLTGKMIHLAISTILSLAVISALSGQLLLSFFLLTMLIIGIAISTKANRKRKLAVAIP